VTVRVPQSGDAERLTAAVKPGAVAIYDFVPNALGNGPILSFTGEQALYKAVRAASRSTPTAETTDRATAAAGASPERADRANDVRGERFYLFNSKRELLKGPATRPDGLAPQGEALPARSRMLRVPQDVAVIQEAGVASQPESFRGYFVIEDDAELVGSDLAEAETTRDEGTGRPLLALNLTPRGRRVLLATTRRMARRGARVRLSEIPNAEEQERARPSLVIVLDDEIPAKTIINPRKAPGGIDAPNGVLVGVGTKVETDAAAALLNAAPLPAELVPTR